MVTVFKGRRPSFDRSAAPQSAEDLYNSFVTKLRASGLQVETGKFGAMMQVTIENDGPRNFVTWKRSDLSIYTKKMNNTSP